MAHPSDLRDGGHGKGANLQDARRTAPIIRVTGGRHSCGPHSPAAGIETVHRKGQVGTLERNTLS